MKPTFDIFIMEPNGAVMWVQAVESMEKAEERARTLGSLGHTRILIFDQVLGTKHEHSFPAQGAETVQDLNRAKEEQPREGRA